MIKKIFLFIAAIISIVGLIAFYIVNIDGNFHKIDDEAYRSGFLNRYNLEYYIKKHNIKTVLNLRGYSEEKWHVMENNITNKLKVKLIDYNMNNSNIYDYNHTLEILEILKNAKKPILIHCLGGADRTSLVSAIYLYGVKNKTKEEAKKQLSWYYGHIPFLRPHVKSMDRSFDIFTQKHLQ